MDNLIMLDYDGTIVDSLGVFCQACVSTFRHRGFPQFATCERAVAFMDDNWFAALAAAGVPDDVVVEMEDVFADLADPDAAVPPVPFEGMAKVLERLARRNTLVVITSSRARTVERMFARRGIGGIAGVLGADTDASKLRKIARARAHYDGRLRPWYVGDTVGDILEARAAGVRSVGVAWGWQHVDKLLAASPDLIAYRPEDLLALE
jgi:phosphoglycolate phosphatase